MAIDNDMSLSQTDHGTSVPAQSRKAFLIGQTVEEAESSYSVSHRVELPCGGRSSSLARKLPRKRGSRNVLTI